MMPENNEEISIKDLFFKIGSFFRFLISRWVILLTSIIIGAGIGLLIAINTRPTYTATLTFVLSPDSKSDGLAGLANQYGLDLGGSGGNDVFSGENILTLFKSYRMIKPVLFKKPPGFNDILANIIVKEWKWDKKWLKKRRTKDQFPFPLDSGKLNPIQDSLIREVHTVLIDKNLSVSRKDKKLSVYEVDTKTTSEVFACYLTRYLMDETARFYIDTKTSLARLNLSMLQGEIDSLRTLLGGVISTTATDVDRTFSLNPALQVERAPAQKNQVRSAILATAYGEVVKNMEIAKITLQKETPLYQIIDAPEMPLKIQKAPILLFAILGGVFAFLLTIMILAILKKVR